MSLEPDALPRADVGGRLMPFYLRNFECILHTSFTRYSHLLTPAEVSLFHTVLHGISPNSRRLFVRLCSRKGPWFRQSGLVSKYGVGPACGDGGKRGIDQRNPIDVPTAIRELVSTGLALDRPLIDPSSFEQLPDDPDHPLHHLFALLQADDVRRLAGTFGVPLRTSGPALPRQVVAVALLRHVQTQRTLEGFFKQLPAKRTNSGGPSVLDCPESMGKGALGSLLRATLQMINEPIISLQTAALAMCARLFRVFFLTWSAEITQSLEAAAAGSGRHGYARTLSSSTAMEEPEEAEGAETPATTTTNPTDSCWSGARSRRLSAELAGKLSVFVLVGMEKIRFPAIPAAASSRLLAPPPPAGSQAPPSSDPTDCALCQRALGATSGVVVPLFASRSELMAWEVAMAEEIVLGQRVQATIEELRRFLQARGLKPGGGTRRARPPSPSASSPSSNEAGEPVPGDGRAPCDQKADARPEESAPRGRCALVVLDDDDDDEPALPTDSQPQDDGASRERGEGGQDEAELVSGSDDDGRCRRKKSRRRPCAGRSRARRVSGSSGGRPARGRTWKADVCLQFPISHAPLALILRAGHVYARALAESGVTLLERLHRYPQAVGLLRVLLASPWLPSACAVPCLARLATDLGHLSRWTEAARICAAPLRLLDRLEPSLLARMRGAPLQPSFLDEEPKSPGALHPPPDPSQVSLPSFPGSPGDISETCLSLQCHPSGQPAVDHPPSPLASRPASDPLDGPTSALGDFGGSSPSHGAVFSLDSDLAGVATLLHMHDIMRRRAAKQRGQAKVQAASGTPPLPERDHVTEECVVKVAASSQPPVRTPDASPLPRPGPGSSSPSSTPPSSTGLPSSVLAPAPAPITDSDGADTLPISPSAPLPTAAIALPPPPSMVRPHSRLGRRTERSARPERPVVRLSPSGLSLAPLRPSQTPLPRPEKTKRVPRTNSGSDRGPTTVKGNLIRPRQHPPARSNSKPTAVAPPVVIVLSDDDEGDPTPPPSDHQSTALPDTTSTPAQRHVPLPGETPAPAGTTELSPPQQQADGSSRDGGDDEVIMLSASDTGPDTLPPRAPSSSDATPASTPAHRASPDSPDSRPSIRDDPPAATLLEHLAVEVPLPAILGGPDGHSNVPLDTLPPTRVPLDSLSCRATVTHLEAELLTAKRAGKSVFLDQGGADCSVEVSAPIPSAYHPPPSTANFHLDSTLVLDHYRTDLHWTYGTQDWGNSLVGSLFGTLFWPVLFMDPGGPDYADWDERLLAAWDRSGSLGPPRPPGPAPAWSFSLTPDPGLGHPTAGATAVDPQPTAQATAVFQTPFQDAPLDMVAGETHFYRSRSAAIRRRLRFLWGLSGVQAEVLVWWACRRYRDIRCRGINWSRFTDGYLAAAAGALGGPGLALICELIARDPHMMAGVPDLFLWRARADQDPAPIDVLIPPATPAGGGDDAEGEESQRTPQPISGSQQKTGDASADSPDVDATALPPWSPAALPPERECLFVEVKGPRDHLSDRQVVWLNMLISAGIQAHVCRVSDRPR
ncbi:hypothetical protein PAPYR_1183 [Paratrimastix pyriformis]|uniref:Fanconi-associated nuclease n=1 Tax=Paratrimastix pyriformis TaxID=342808 RepID=A0ABQ8UUB1_9EUKA|nr:hypothetical protein PAPYR_1183 [Paratrimastix pyriformis]